MKRRLAMYSTAGFNDARSHVFTCWEVYKGDVLVASMPATSNPRYLDKYIEDDECEIYECKYLGEHLQANLTPFSKERIF